MEAAQSTPERTRAPGSAALAPYQHRSLQERCLANAAKLALKSLATVAAAGAAGGDMAAVAQANRQGLLLRECQVLTTAAAMDATPDPTFPLLALPGDALDHIAYLLPPADRCNLAATCSTLRTAGRCWFRGAVVQVYTVTPALRRWIEEHQVSVAYLLCGTASQIHAGLASLPAGQVVAIRHEPAYAPWAVPAALTALTALTRLPLSRQTQLSDGSALDEILQPLVQLKELSLDHCRLAAVPAALSRCAQLTSLNLNNNALAGGWEHLQPLSRLQTLWMCDAADVSASLAYITGLSWLDLARCGNVPAASRHLAGLRLLSFLNLTSCGLAEVPAAVSALTALEALFLSHNRLAGGFDHLRPLARLNALYLHNNDLREVPAALSVLTALGALTLGNPEGGGWQRLRPLLKLASLDAFWHLDQAPASHLPVASEALRNLHPAAVERMLAQPDSSITRLLGLLERHGLPPPL